jgi:hypothetical protein
MNVYTLIFKNWEWKRPKLQLLPGDYTCCLKVMACLRSTDAVLPCWFICKLSRLSLFARKLHVGAGRYKHTPRLQLLPEDCGDVPLACCAVDFRLLTCHVISLRCNQFEYRRQDCSCYQKIVACLRSCKKTLWWKWKIKTHTKIAAVTWSLCRSPVSTLSSRTLLCDEFGCLYMHPF